MRLGPFVDGIPTSIDGVTVHVGDEAQRALERSLNAESFLIGGWFHAGRAILSCPVYLYGTRWGCNAWIWLYSDATAPEARFVYPADPPNLADVLVFGETRPVVLRVHTHESACPSDFEGCDLLPVEEAVAWIGAAVAP